MRRWRERAVKWLSSEMDCLPARKTGALLLLMVCSLAGGAPWPIDAAIGDARGLAPNDFESGAMSPWFDESAADAKWYLESFDDPFDPSVPVPPPPVGSKYLRVQRPPGTSGQAALRSELFTAEPGDELRFSFWIRSQILQTNNLEVLSRQPYRTVSQSIVCYRSTGKMALAWSGSSVSCNIQRPQILNGGRRAS